MLQKLIFLILTVVFLSGCGASAPAAEKAADSAQGDANTLMLARTDGTEAAAYAGTATTESSTEASLDTDSTVEYFLFTNTDNTLTDDEGTILL